VRCRLGGIRGAPEECLYVTISFPMSETFARWLYVSEVVICVGRCVMCVGGGYVVSEVGYVCRRRLCVSEEVMCVGGGYVVSEVGYVCREEVMCVGGGYVCRRWVMCVGV